MKYVASYLLYHDLELNDAVKLLVLVADTENNNEPGYIFDPEFTVLIKCHCNYLITDKH
jgi:hypothetical protein